ncbi:hypothetical protein H696_01638 [Fonticula alba]|uniref:J domain-containing protein n=1 Tax=Fonticula alba TaxID=691883 RepID=A0A058ZFI3_FONAL|nr:hypothetical protein H696_01638 [Fonticula alba]KCV72237.1 hypothetical protein H696_01638 [Fonticula alba]|eukprot:XP_009493815.1 hypothetical protein H696_01638 [Fonticula alba]
MIPGTGRLVAMRAGMALRLLRVGSAAPALRPRCLVAHGRPSGLSFQMTAGRLFSSATPPGPGTVCWGCGTALAPGSHQCGACARINPQLPLTGEPCPFEVLGLATSPPGAAFDVDLRALRSLFLEQQMLMHPDRLAGAGAHLTPAQVEYSERLSKAVTEAHRVLRDPVQRAFALLRAHGHPIDDGTTNVDSELLMLAFMAQETIESGDPDEMNDLAAENDQRTQEDLEHFRASLAANDLEQAQKVALRLRYWQTITNGLREKQDI